MTAPTEEAPGGTFGGTRAVGGALSRHFIGRISGLPTDVVDALRAPACECLVQKLGTVAEEIARARETVSDALHAAVGAAEGEIERRILLRVRRALYNGRRPTQDDLAMVRERLAPSAYESVRLFALALDREAQLLKELAESYGSEARAARQRLRACIASPDLQRGLVLSSPSLFAGQQRYRRLAADAEVTGKAERAERGLLRFLTRTALKATPFSTLGSIAPGVLVEPDNVRGAERTEVTLAGDPLAKRSAVRLNKVLLSSFVSPLQMRPMVRRHLTVGVNSTLRRENGHYVYLAVWRGREVFRRLPASPTVDIVLETLEQHVAPSLEALIARVAGDTRIETSAEDASAFLEKLVGAGLLQLHTGVREQALDWDRTLRDVLAPIPDEGAQLVAATLEYLRSQVEAYERGSADERRTILADTQERVTSTLSSINQRRTVGPLPFMEDAVAACTTSLPWTRDLRRIEADLIAFFGWGRSLTWPRGEQATMRHFFDAHYGAATEAVPLLGFYEDFYREHQKAHLEKQRMLEDSRGDSSALGGYDLSNPFGLPVIDQMRMANARIVGLIERRWFEALDSEEIDICSADIAALVESVPRPPVDPVSLHFFADVIPGRADGRRTRLVMTKASAMGYGRMFSRFLYLLPDEVREAMIDANREHSGAMLAEIWSDGNHNANLHPPLLESSIHYPATEQSDGGNQVEPRDLVVVRRPDDPHSLILRHRLTGERVIPIDLGFSYPPTRPAFYQLLCNFTLAVDFSIRVPHLPTVLDREGGPADESPAADTHVGDGHRTSDMSLDWESVVVRRPRITFNGTIVLHRQCWRVPTCLVPQTEVNEGAFDFFVRINRWRMEHGIPREVYVHASEEGRPVVAEPDDEEAETEAAAQRPVKHDVRARLKLWKPQYVDFESPLLVNMFGRLGAPMDLPALIFSERLPDADDLPRCNGQSYAFEGSFRLDLEGPACGDWASRGMDPL